MAKLIHASALANVKLNSALFTNNDYTAAAKSALIFTDDGHIVVKGTDYKVALASGSISLSVGTGSDAGKLKITDAAGFSATGPRIDQVRTDPLADSTIMYLAGALSAATSSNPITSSLSTKSSVYVETSSAGLAKLVVPELTITEGATSLVLNNQTLQDYITDKISQGLATNDAMVFAGTLKVNGSDLIFVSHNANLDFGVTVTDNTTKLSDITKYSAGWTFKIVTSGGTVTNIGTVEIGDMLISTVDQATAYSASNWNVIQANIDGAVTAVSALTANGIVLGAGNKTAKILTTVNTAGYLKPNGSSEPEWSTFGELTLDGTVNFVFNPAKSSTLVIGSGLDISSSGSGSTAVYTLEHSNSVTEQTTAALKKFSFDAQGHITGVADVPTLTFSALDSGGNSVNSAGISDKTYNGSAATTIALKAGSNITLTQTTSGTIQIASAYTNTWRPVYAWLLSELGAASDTIDEMLGSGISTRSLAFSSTFGYSEKSVTVGGNSINVAELDLVWAEVAADGTISYNI